MSRTIETERLALRLRDPDDASWSLALLGERDGGTTLTLDDARRRLEAQAADAIRNGFGFLAIRRRVGSDDVEDEPIGYCGLLVGRATFDEPEIAYELFRHSHGHGYATEAAAAVLEAAFATGRTRIWSTVGAWNTASLRVLDKIGFRRDHTVVDDDGEVVWLVHDGR